MTSSSASVLLPPTGLPGEHSGVSVILGARSLGRALVRTVRRPSRLRPGLTPYTRVERARRSCFAVWSFPSVDSSFLFFIVMFLFIPLLVVLVVVDAVLR